MVDTSTRAGIGEDLYDWLGQLREEAPVCAFRMRKVWNPGSSLATHEAASVLGDRRFSKEPRHAEEALRQQAWWT
jgi:hypothetical protein